MRWRFEIDIEIEPSKTRFKSLRERISMAVNSLEGHKFIDIHVAGAPDHYSLPDPDNPPALFE